VDQACVGKLAAYADGELTPRAARQVEIHLAQCARCRTERDEVGSGIAMMEHLPSIGAPDAIWTAIEATLHDHRPATMPVDRSWRLAAVAAAALVALAGAAIWRVVQPSGTRWEVRRLDGRPAVGGRAVSGAGQVGIGESIETDAESRATVTIGRDLGRWRLDRARACGSWRRGRTSTGSRSTEGRSAPTISASPRLFFVETASGTAVDLGCEYALNTDEDGSGLLRVTRGWVSFQWTVWSRLVPAGASCPTRPRIGPGLPYFDDATEAIEAGAGRLRPRKGRPPHVGCDSCRVPRPGHAQASGICCSESRSASGRASTIGSRR